MPCLIIFPTSLWINGTFIFQSTSLEYDLIYSRHIRVLVPGAGLGRLAYDVAKLGMILAASKPSLIP